MSLTEYERRCLDELAQQIGREDPLLSRMLTRGRWLSRPMRAWHCAIAFAGRRRWWQWAFTVLVLGGLAVLLAAARSLQVAVMAAGAGILISASIGLCLTVLAVHRRRRRVPPSWAQPPA